MIYNMKTNPPTKLDFWYPTLDDISECSEDNWFILDKEGSIVWVSPSGMQFHITTGAFPEPDPAAHPAQQAWLVEGIFTWTENPFWIGDLFYDFNTLKSYPTGTVIHCHYRPLQEGAEDIPSERLEMDTYLPTTANRIGFSHFTLGGHT